MAGKFWWMLRETVRDGSLSHRMFDGVVHWICYYHVEVILGIIVYWMAAMLLVAMSSVEEGVFSNYEGIMLLLVLMLLIVVAVGMSNTARTRASAAQILEELRGTDAGKR